MLDLGASTGPPLIGGGEDALTIEGYDRQSPASTGPPLIGGGEMASETKQTEEA